VGSLALHRTCYNLKKMRQESGGPGAKPWT
jgi:hypothetical protein